MNTNTNSRPHWSATPLEDIARAIFQLLKRGAR